MAGKFVPSAQATKEVLDWGQLLWFARPAETELRNLVVIEVRLKPGAGHAFHKHPQQEEVIYCLQGQVEQWLEKESCVLNPGDAVIVPADTVHASFNVGDQEARLLAILGPAIGDQNGYEVTELAEQEPWATLLRKRGS